jgi:hypothetical protein
MSKEALAKVVQLAIGDASFRRQLSSDTAGALRGFDLSTDEVSALRAGDAGRLSTLGVDQRMSRAFANGGMAAATRMAQSDLTAGAPTAFDDGASGVGRMIIPHDPEAAATKDLDGGPGSNRSALNDDPDGFLAANARATGGTGSVRTGDDWKYADRGSAAAPVEGSPEADAAAQEASGAGMANYPAHHGLAGPSAVGSSRAGDDWARAGSAKIDDSGRIGAARLDDASGASGGARSVNDDPDGFLAANKNADFSGATAGDGTAFLDESEAYLTKVGYDSPAATTANARATWSGDENAGPASVAGDDGGASPNATEGGPNITP